MSNNFYHRGVVITLNLKPVVDEMAKHFLRLIEQVNPLFLNNGPLAKTIQKRWYGKQLLAANGESFGFLYFSVQNHSILKRDFDLESPLSEVKELEYSFHVKQSVTQSQARNFTSASMRFKNTWGEFNTDDVSFHLYGGTDIEYAIILRELIAEIKDQMLAFNADNDTFIAQNELDLIPFIMHRGNN